jgi:4-amino-4-deoxy-L-arabinose transferase-like glycosyltransferase
VSRLRSASKAPVAVAGILAVPLFFVGLMAFSLKVDKPSHHLTKKGTVVLGDPTKGTVGTIYLLAVAVSVAVVLVGLLAMLLRSRLATIVPAVAAIAASVLLMLPLATWAAQHTKRFPLGVDNIPATAPTDQFLRGEWEQTAKTTAEQIGFVTIGLGLAAIVLTVALEIRRRRGRESPPVQPLPVELDTGGAPLL